MTSKTIIKRISIHDYGEYILPIDGVWGNCQFNLSADCRRYDWLVVFDDLPDDERLVCPPENTILVMTEPATVKIYPDNYINQFGYVICPQDKFLNAHPNIKYGTATLDWSHGFIKSNGKIMQYEEMINFSVPPKNKKISIVCSNKTITPFHRKRLDFVNQLNQSKAMIDFYGFGISPIKDKADALLPYYGHIAIENYICQDYWTEKLVDPLLAYTVPFYCGCPNINDYIPAESYIPIDLNDIDTTLSAIHYFIENMEYKQHLESIKEARYLLLTKYHPYNQIVELLEENGTQLADNGGVIRTRNHCIRNSGTYARFSYLWKKKRYKYNTIFGL